jgi:GTP cyclohydrolase I
VKRKIMTEKNEELIYELLLAIGDNPNREGLLNTPKRVVNSWKELYSGYNLLAEDVLKTTFIDGTCDEMVILDNINFYSTCEHHCLPFFGKVHIGYIPDKKIVGISKLSRLVEVFSRRLQIQERMTTQIADAIQTCLEPKGSIVCVTAQHFCMTSRGVKQEKAKMKTSAIKGAFTDEKLRAEFFNLIRL